MKKDNKEKATYVYMPIGMALGLIVETFIDNKNKK